MVRGSAELAGEEGVTGGRRAPGGLLPIALLVGGLVVFGVLSVACWSFYDDAEHRLLEDRTGEASALLAVSVAQVRSPLDSAATLARVTDGDPGAVRAVAVRRGRRRRDVLGRGAVSDRISGTRWHGSAIRSGLLRPGAISSSGSSRPPRVEPFVVIDLLDSGRRLGYAVVDNDERSETTSCTPSGS